MLATHCLDADQLNDRLAGIVESDSPRADAVVHQRGRDDAVPAEPNDASPRPQA